MRTTGRLGWYVTIIYATIPAVLLSVTSSFVFDFSSVAGTLNTLGRVSALTGLALFSLAFVLNTRVSFLENLFGGLNKVFIAHHIVGSFAFVFLLFHPLFLVLSLASFSVDAAVQLIIPGVNIVTLGIVGLSLLTFFLVTTLFFKPPYHIWRFIHQFIGIAFFFGAAHALFIPSDIASNLIVRYYMLFLVGLGVVSYFYKTVFGRITMQQKDFVVKEINWLDKKVVEITLAPVKETLRYKPGQFVFLSFMNSSLSKEAHPFSITSSPKESLLTVVIKKSGDFTRKLDMLKVGDGVKVEGPYGKFTYADFPNRKQVWIAGGIGITPFISMIKDVKNNRYDIDLFYVTSTKSDAVYLKKMKRLTQEKKGVKVYPLFTATQGRLTVEKIKKLSGVDIKDREILLCGPLPMMQHIKKQLQLHGVKTYRIHSEEFELA